MTEPLIITRTFAASPELVFGAWTKPEQFSVWFGSEAVDVPLDTLAMDVRVGGAWNAVMHLPSGHKIFWVGEYTEVNPFTRLAMTMTDDPSAPAGAPLTVDLVEVDGGTEMTLTQIAGHFTQEQRAQTILGYNGFFDAMEKVIAAQS
ncbi:MAG: SRPBCC domain-containing protein [Streptosporangiaceae bacterium]